MKKTCRKCLVEKDIECFAKSKRHSDGKYTSCKECRNIETKRKYYENHEQHLKQKRISSKKSYLRNKEKLNKARKMYREKRREYYIEYDRLRNQNPEIRIRKNNQAKNRYHSNIQCKIKHRLSAGMLKKLSNVNASKISKTVELLGCSIQEFRVYLESKFESGMTWENYGYRGWHIDHIKPCAMFDLTKKEDQQKCFHYSNMQPLWAKDNMSKGARFIGRKRDSVKSHQPVQNTQQPFESLERPFECLAKNNGNSNAPN